MDDKSRVGMGVGAIDTPALWSGPYLSRRSLKVYGPRLYLLRPTAYPL